MSEKLRFGLVGCGSFSKNFSGHLLKVGDIVALCDVDPTRTKNLADHRSLKSVRHYTDYRKMIDDGAIDAVIVTAANFVHAEITCAAAEAGLHVFCEKAMARTTKECWQMALTCHEHGVKLMVGHKRRLRPPWARMIELTDDAILGSPLALSVNQYADQRPYDIFESWWSDPVLSGGHLHYFGVHVIDWFRAMCGDIVSVWATAGPQQDPRYQYPDIYHANFQFSSGAIASLSSSMSFPLHLFRESQGPYAQCKHGGFKLVPSMDHIDLYWQRLDEKTPHHERFDDLGFDHAFGLETHDFAKWITENKEPCLTWIEGLRCVEAMDAAYRSAESGGQLVTLPICPSEEQLWRQRSSLTMTGDIS